MTRCFDIAVVGAGPVALCFARSLSGLGLRIALIEKQPLSALSVPAFDGREIALTHRSVRILRDIGVWERIPDREIAPVREARVLNGPSTYFMNIEPGHGNRGELGFLVPNHLIRKAAHESVAGAPGVELLAEERVADIRTAGNEVSLTLAGGSQLTASLLVAADGRFSETRRLLGIPAALRDFGRTMLLCRMQHERPHGQVACEWFDYGQTVAILPLAGNCSSIVITLPDGEAQRLRASSEADFNSEVERRLRHRMGRMRRISPLCAYPLVGVNPRRLIAPRCALLGDAALGMHPVTAHGFNFGLYGQATLADEIGKAVMRGADIGSAALLSRYERAHRLATMPLYLATNAIVTLYNLDVPPARLARDLLLRLANNVTPFKRMVAASLTRG